MYALRIFPKPLSTLFGLQHFLSEHFFPGGTNQVAHRSYSPCFSYYGKGIEFPAKWKLACQCVVQLIVAWDFFFDTFTYYAESVDRQTVVPALSPTRSYSNRSP